MPNTVMVVEHDEDTIRSADFIVDLGPGAGKCGGEVVYRGDLCGLLKHTKSLTAKYLNGELQIEIPHRRRKYDIKHSIVCLLYTSPSTRD